MQHIPIMVKEIIDTLVTDKSGIYVDATIGFAGHTKHILDNLSNGRVIGIDRDSDALRYISQISDLNIKENGNNLELFKSNFGDLDSVLLLAGVEEVDGILADIGVSSFQIDKIDRGFSYMQDGPLDMRMDRDMEKDARFVVNRYTEENLADIIYKYGEERFSRRIAKEIVNRRKLKSFDSTKDLASMLLSVTRSLDSVKRVFQAIRIEVNDELSNLETFLNKVSKCLKINGRVAIITFHSLEDRIVKNYFKNSNLKQVHKKAIVATDTEITKNSRSKSAKLRIAERVY